MSCNFLTVKQVAEILGKCDKFVYQHQKEIPGYFKFCGAILFDKELLMDELKKRAKQSVKSATAISGSSHGL